MPFSLRDLAPTALAVLALAPPLVSHANPITLVASDARGVTLRVEVPEHTLSTPDADGRVRVAVRGFEVRGESGRPALPVAAKLVALPPDAVASVRVVAAEGERTVTGLALQPLGRSRMVEDPGGMGFVPVVEPQSPLVDGPWPQALAEGEEPFELRRQRVMVLRVQPFRWDESTRTLTRWSAVTVRVEFSGGASGRPGLSGAVSDPRWDPVLRGAIANFEQGRAWRAVASPLRRSPMEVLGGPQRDARRASAALGSRVDAATLFDEDQAEVRARIDTTGVYSLRYVDLAAKGFPSGIAVNRVSVHRHEFVEGADPPYVTLELPIEVDDNNTNGVFDTGDRIVVWVQNWAERSRATGATRAWGDYEVIYATHLVSRDGLRVPTRPGWLDQTLTPLASYPDLRRFERTGFHMNTVQPGFSSFTPFESDTNTDAFLWTGLGLPDRNDPQFSDAFPFEVQDLDNTRPIRVRLQWQGLKGNTHNNWADVRGANGVATLVVDSLVWGDRLTLTRSATLPGTAITNGATNRFRTWGRTLFSTSGIVNVGLNWFDVRYYRAFKAIRGYLPCTNDSTAGAYQINGEGFNTRNIRVYDVSDSLQPVRLSLADTLITATGSTFRVRWQDSTPGAQIKRYVAFDVPKLVVAAKLTPVTRQNLHARGAGTYLLITPEAFLPASELLAAHRATQGHDTLVATVEAINDEFNGGRTSAYAVRRFVKWAYDRWNSSFVTLMGDGSIDPQNQTGTAGIDWIPTQKIAGPVGIPDGVTVYEVVPSDPWYVWQLARLGPIRGLPKLHDMYIGRLPVNSPEQALAVAQKLVRYDTVTPDQTWRRKMLLLPDDQYSTESFFGGDPGGPSYCFKSYESVFRTISDHCRDVVLQGAGLSQSQVEIYDLQVELEGKVDVTGTCRDSWSETQAYTHNAITPELFRRLNEGQMWWNYQGHANQFVLTHEDLYKNIGFDDDKTLYANVDKPFLFTAFSCHPNGFALPVEGDPQRGPSLGEEMVTLPQMGAIASWGSSAYELIPSTFLTETHLNVYFAKALFSDPPLDTLGDRGARVLLGESIQQSLLLNTFTTAGLEDSVGITYHLMGDPAMPVSVGHAQSIVIANGIAVTDDQPVRLRTVGAGLQIEADLVSNVRITSIVLERTLNGVTTVVPTSEYTLAPAFPDTGLGTEGGRRFHLTFATTLTPDTYTFTIRTVDRNGVAGAFDILLPFQSVLRADGDVIGSGDVVAAGAELSLTVLSPSPLVVPSGLTVTLDGQEIPYEAQPANGDTTGREWTLLLTTGTLTVDEHVIQVSAQGGATRQHTFRVDDSGDNVAVRNLLAFPNPFDEERGTHFSFQLATPSPADVQIRVYTVSGRLIYQRTESSLSAGYRQLPWNGLDAEGNPIANGVYVYKVLARNGDKTDVVQGRLVKLRRPRRQIEPETTP